MAPLTPVEIFNRPGLDALVYRAGTHAQFFETMQARLSTVTVEGAAADGQTQATWRPLQGLTTRDRSDLSIALLDGWATVADVLTFYQERIANEGFLRTATERRSVLELARLVGYTLRPGVAATAYLAYTLDEKQVEPVIIAAGARSQSTPGPGESPQTFETSEDLVARGAWNNLQVRRQRPQNITLDGTAVLSHPKLSIDRLFEALRASRHVLTIDTLLVAGTATGLKAGDKLLFTFSEDGSTAVVRSVESIDTVFADQQTAVKLQPSDREVVVCSVFLATCIERLERTIASQADDDFDDATALDRARTILKQVYLGGASTPGSWTNTILKIVGTDKDLTLTKAAGTVVSDLNAIIIKLRAAGSGAGVGSPTGPDDFVRRLLVPEVPQAANGLQLKRALTSSLGNGADAGPQLLVHFAPRLDGTFYRAWAGANVNATAPALKGVYALRTRCALFGAAASKLPEFFGDHVEGHQKGELRPIDEWKRDWRYADDESGRNAFLDQANEALRPGGYVLAHFHPAGHAFVRHVLRIAEASVSPRSEYGLNGPSTALVFEGSTSWRSMDKDPDPNNPRRQIADLRRTQIYAQSEPLTLVGDPITTPVGEQRIELDGVYNELKSGRWVILSGERADIPGVAGVPAAELLMISGLEHGFDKKVAGDQVHSTLILATAPAFKYRRDTLKIYGNVVKATHGETRNEVLGSGEGAQVLQTFALKQPPLTFVAAPTPTGVESTLRIYVDNVAWREADSLAGLGPRARRFVTATDDAANTQVTFGNGNEGARLPTGAQNVSATYRNGIGAGGNVRADQVSLLVTRPLGVTAVINPLRASVGADKEPRDLARESAPLSVMPLDRLVSVADYADFTRGFAVIAKAVARRVTDGKRQLVHLTIAGADDIPIDPTSDLYRSLLSALRKLGDRDLPVQVDRREQVALVLSAGVKLLPDRQWETVVADLRARLLDAFGFDKRALGQPALRCEVMSAMQSVPGVAYVDIDAFGGVPEMKEVGKDGKRELLGLKDVADIVAAITGTTRNATSDGERVPAFPGGVDHGVVRPAQLAIFIPSIADTLILNQLP